MRSSDAGLRSPSGVRTDSRLRAGASVWAACHGLTWAYVSGFAALWLFSVLLAGVGVPRADPSPEQGMVDMHSIALVGVAAATGYATIALENHSPWITVASPRKLWRVRALWILAVTIFTALIVFLVSFFLPPSLPRFTGYGAVAGLMLGLAFIAASVAGRYAGMLAPLVLVSGAIAKMIPWDWNILFRSDAPHQRVITAAILLTTGIVIYAWKGHATSRRAL